MKRFALLLASAAMIAGAPARADEAGLKGEIALLKAQIAAQNQVIADQAQRLNRIEAELHAAPAQVAPAQVAASAPTSPSAAPPPSAEPAAPAQDMAMATPPAKDTTIGGYGEASYNAYVHDGSRNQADLKRFVLFFAHRFNDKLSLNSEVEFEHAVASADDRGEAEIEQAWLNYAFKPSVNLKAGLFLMPFGFINRNHEPPAFYGVERNEVETRIIPSTWREGGVALWGTTNFGLSYDVGVTTGFSFAKSDDPAAPLASMHQELQLAHAANLSVYGSLEYVPTPGLTLGGGVFTGKTGQANADFRANGTGPDYSGIDARLVLWDMRARLQRGGFDLEALYTRGTISQTAAIDRAILDYNANSSDQRSLIPASFYGWLVQGAYTFALGGEMSLSPFARYERYDTQARLPLGLAADPANRDRVLTGGFSFKPIGDVVIKLDYQKFIEHSANDRFNFGIGYQF